MMLPRQAQLVPRLLVLVLGAASLVGCGQEQNDPDVAVQEFLIAAGVDHDGEQACSYLTGRARRAAERNAGPGARCPELFDAATLPIDGEDEPDVEAVRDLPIETSGYGRRREVVVTVGDETRTLGLVEADPDQEREFEAPDTHWRIDSGAGFLVPSGPPA